MTTDRNMVLIAFLQAQNCTNYPASWRHPAATQDFTSARFYQDIVRKLDASKFPLAFFDDRLAIPDIHADDFRTTVKDGYPRREAGSDALRLGDGVRHRAYGDRRHLLDNLLRALPRRPHLRPLDNLSGGRAARNVVTSLNASEAANFGREELEHDLR